MHIDTRVLDSAIRVDTIRGAIRLARPGTELDVLLPDDCRGTLEALVATPMVCWFSPASPGRYQLVVRHADSPACVSEYLAWDHDRLDAALARALSAAAAVDWDGASAATTTFRIGLLRHIDIEERLLFPAFEERTGVREGGPTHVMRMEHDEIKEAVASITESVARRDLDGLMHWHANLLGVLVEHNMKEEQILYPGTDRLLPPVELESLVRRMLLT